MKEERRGESIHVYVIVHYIDTCVSQFLQTIRIFALHLHVLALTACVLK